MRRAALFTIAACAALLIGGGLALAVETDQLVHVNRTPEPGNVAGDAGAVITFNAVSGKLVAFSSNAANLPGSNTHHQAYVRDTASGTTTLVSTVSGATGPDSANDSVSDVAISGNGRYVVYATAASNIVAGDANSTFDVFRHDLVTRATVLVSENTSGGVGDDESRAPSISSDGGRVAFWSEAEDLVSDDDNAMADAFVRDIAGDSTTRVSVASDDGQGSGETEEEGVEISGNGQLVAFTSNSNLIYPDDGSLPAGTNDTDGATPELYVRSVDGSVATELASRSHDASAADGGMSVHPSLSSDGRYIAFQSEADNIVAGVSGTHTYVRDRVAGTTTLAGRGDGAAGAVPSAGSTLPSISDDGRFVAFHTGDIAINPSGAAILHVHRRDIVNGTTALISRGAGAAGAPADANSTMAAIAPAGDAVAFVSTADNLAAETGADDQYSNVFLRIVVPVVPATSPAGPPPASQLPAPTRPKITKFKLSPSKFRTVRKGRKGGGSKLHLTVDQDVTFTATVMKVKPKRKKGTWVGGFTGSWVASGRTMPFPGVIKGKRLKPGNYILTITVKNAAGDKGDPTELKTKFTTK